MSDVDLQNRIKGFLDSALENFIVSNYNDAIRDLKAAEVLDKNNPEILYNLGVNYSRLGLYKTAVMYYERLLNLSVTFVDVLTIRKLYAYAMINMDNLEGAERALDDVIRLNPSDTAAHNMKGYCLEKRENFSEAIIAYKSIINIDNKNYNAYNSLAYILSRSGGDMKMALEYSTIACDSDKENAAYLDTKGFVYLKMGQARRAEEIFRRALKLKPLSREIKSHLEEAISARGNAE